MAKRLLLADDSVTIQKVVGISFANEDVELVTVDNGDDAILRAREIRPDVILADVVMPGKNGYEVCEAIKNDVDLAQIPVLLLTGTFEAFDEERAASARSDGHITKPFEAQALVDKVNALLGASVPAPEAAPEPVAPVAATPVAPAPAVQQEPPAPVSAGDDDGFDFFDDELETGDGPPSENASTAFELEAGESAFDFAPIVDAPGGATGPPSDNTTVVTPAPVPPPPAGGMPDATVALGIAPPDLDEGWGDDELDAAFSETAPPTEPPAADDPSARTTVFQLDAPSPAEDDLAALPESPAAPEPSDDFSFGPESGDDFLGDFDAADPPREAVSNPELGRDFAVSSSDLGDPLGADFAAEPAAEPAVEPVEAAFEPGPEPVLEADFPATPEPSCAEAPFAEPAHVPTVAPAETAFAGEDGPVFDAEPEDLPFHASPEMTEVPIEAPVLAFEAPEETGEDLVTPLAEAAAEDFAPAPAEVVPTGEEAGSSPDLSPLMRERVHEAMEKIAWEAFADLPDQIVRQALARIEAIAWEVIPQMAEAMIQEEIRRMKGESE